MRSPAVGGRRLTIKVGFKFDIITQILIGSRSGPHGDRKLRGRARGAARAAYHARFDGTHAPTNPIKHTPFIIKNKQETKANGRFRCS